MAYESNFDYNGDVSKVSKITFGIMSPDMIRDQSVVQVIYHDTFCGNNPVTGGLFDPRMGVLEYGQICTTDKQSNKDTPGYFGHIELALPIFHIQYFPVVHKIVRCICYRCSNLLVEESKYDYSIPKKNRISYVSEIAKKTKICPNSECRAVQPNKFVKTDSCKVQAIWMTTSTGNKESSVEVESRKLLYTPKYVLNLFKQISNETCEKLGLNPKLSHPSWMIMTVFPVCPPSCRPSVHQENGQRMEDDITIKYCDIIKYNNLIKDKLSNDPESKIIDDWHNLLQYHISTLIDNEIAGVPPAAQRSGRPLKGLRQRLKGKEGRIRGNLMGKRVNFSSRTVITPDPVIDLDELGVPKKIAIQLTYPEKVTASNMNRLKGCIRNGCKVYPGARAVYKKRNRKTVSLNHIDRYQFSQMLEIGDIVVRHITNRDWVLFNRQPSLHKMSMMAHRIRILDGLTFRLNISATTPYNADFDGDEMNMHVPQSIATSNEISCLASVNKQIVSPALNMPIITFVQDAVLGGHRMTMDATRKLNHREMMNALSWTKAFNGKLEYKLSFTGKEGLSYCIPDTTLRIKNRRGKHVFIKNGNISSNSDRFDKKVFTTLIHSIFRDNGAEKCASFFNSAQHMIRSFMLKNSFTVGIRDLVLEDDLNEAIEKAIQQQIMEAEKTIQTLHLNMFENLTSESNKVAFENKVNQKLTAARSCAENLLKKCYDNIEDNRFMNMVDGGSKGKLINLAQMTACLGQQAIDGGRAPYGFDCRTLPHFEKYDDKALARGFVANSFQKGINPIEFFFHAMAGREGIIDTAVKSVTWDTKIVIIENNRPKYTEIGKWIDNKLDDEVYKENIEKHQEMNLELLNIQDVFIPTTDYDGNVSWQEVTAMTRHDPGVKLFKIKTLSGRIVTVTANKSLLIWNKDTESFKEKFSKEIIVGDYVPVTANLMKPEHITTYVKIENIDDKFKLNYENGTLIGLCLSSDESITTKNLTNNIDFNISNFISQWYQKNNVKENSETFNNFLKQFIGEKNCKFVPNESFTSPEEFIVGILSGYFSGECSKISISENRIEVVSNSERLIQGISMLCTRIGVFGEIMFKEHNYCFIVSSHWGKTFAEKVSLISEEKNILLNSIKWTKHHKSFKINNDVILDKIITIEVIGTKDNPKMYDLTIPTTFNFSLANGLQVRDTSSTGYIQRKLMKALEDYKVSWSGCVKDAQDDVIQYLFGDDNTDSTAMEFQSIPIIDHEDVFESYYIECRDNDKVKEYCQELKQMKKWYIETICENSPEDKIKFPVNIERILRRIVAENNLEQSDKNTCLTPNFILIKYDELLKQIENNHLNPGTWMVKFMLYMKAGPKRLIQELNFNKSNFSEFIQIFRKLYIRSRIEPGDAVGPVSAQSIGEPCTQLTLNTFHSAGIGGKSNITRGVPRLQELFNLSKNQKQCSLTVRVKNPKGRDKEYVKSISAQICQISIKSLLLNTKLIYEPKPTDDILKFNEFENMFNSFYDSFPKSLWVLILTFDRKKMFEMNICLEEIYYSIKLAFPSGVNCKYSDDNAQELFIRIKIDQHHPDLKKQIVPNVVPEITILNSVCSKLTDEIIIRGIDSITNVTLRQDIRSLTNKEWLIDTEGSNIVDVIIHPDVDGNRTISNDVHEMNQIFGIEAARTTLIREIHEVMDEASEIDARHINLLVDMMTNKGKLIPIDRNGMKLTNVGPLGKCSFEEADQQLYKAAINGDTDYMNGVSANIIVGQVPPCGTGTVDVKLDEDKLLQLLNHSEDILESNLTNKSHQNKSVSFDFDD